jgi:hypothetical protein
MAVKTLRRSTLKDFAPTNSMSGAPPQSITVDYFLAGGGAGGGSRDATGGTGQAGGGNGASSSGAVNGGDASANTGSGGGGAARNGNGGAGGSGLILLKIPTRFTVTFSGGVTQSSATSGSDTIYTITVAGSGETVTIG